MFRNRFDIITNQTNLTAELGSGTVKHSVTAGIEFIYERQNTPTYAAVGTQTAASLYNPSTSDAFVPVARTGAYSKGSTLSALGEKLVWADHRIAARLKPVLDSLASELAAEIDQVVRREAAVLRIHASHGFAIEKLIDALVAGGLRVEHRYDSSTAAAAALHDGACDAAAFHIPLGPAQPAVLAHYARWLDADDLQLIDIATRRQGLVLAAGNPKKIYELADLVRPDVRFINRQAGSGTRLLLEAVLEQAGIATAAIAGFEQGEFTHAAVAAYVASGMADVGFGLETPARQFKLDFLPLASERYFLLCRAATLETPAMQQLLAALRDPAFNAAVDALPGYRAVDAGRVTPLRSAFGGAGRF